MIVDQVLYQVCVHVERKRIEVVLVGQQWRKKVLRLRVLLTEQKSGRTTSWWRQDIGIRDDTVRGTVALTVVSGVPGRVVIGWVISHVVLILRSAPWGPHVFAVLMAVVVLAESVKSIRLIYTHNTLTIY